MKEYLFRAKEQSSGTWFYGDLLTGLDGEMYIRHIVSINQSREVVVTLIDPKTICEFVGLRDKRNVKIFEHDIVLDEYGYKGVVSYIDCGLVVKFLGEDMFDLLSPNNRHIVIGNSFDNQ